MSLGYEFAPIDVNIITHEKALAAGIEALGLWMWGQCYARLQKTGGRIPRIAAFTALGGKRNAVLAKRLVDSGLWVEREDGSWDIHNFIEKGGSSVQTSTERVKRYRERMKRVSPVSETVVGNVSPLTSSSTSVSSDLGSREQPPGQPPDWWGEACDTVEATTGETIDRGPSWLRYSGHRATNGKRMGKPDAQYWLTSVDVVEAKRDRQLARERGDARNNRRDPPKPPEPTPEQRRAFADELSAYVTGKKKVGT